jgi:hypothetical protein
LDENAAPIVADFLPVNALPAKTLVIQPKPPYLKRKAEGAPSAGFFVYSGSLVE